MCLDTFNAAPRDYILIAQFVGMALLPLSLLAGLNFRLYITIRVGRGVRTRCTQCPGVWQEELSDKRASEARTEDCCLASTDSDGVCVL